MAQQGGGVQSFFSFSLFANLRYIVSVTNNNRLASVLVLASCCQKNRRIRPSSRLLGAVTPGSSFRQVLGTAWLALLYPGLTAAVPQPSRREVGLHPASIMTVTSLAAPQLAYILYSI